jgi:hypothetical protein
MCHYCVDMIAEEIGFGYELTKTDLVENHAQIKSRHLFANLINNFEAFYRKHNLGGYPTTRMLYEDALCKLISAQLSSARALEDNNKFFEEMENTTEVKEPTFGETLVGKSFNPSADDKVAQAKELFAKATDLLIDSFDGREIEPMERLLTDIALGDILKAQMMVVKVLTLKK